MTVSQVDFDALKARVTVLETEFADLRTEMGPKDLTATPWHQREKDLTVAFEQFAGRFTDVPGNRLASDVIIEKVKALGLGGGASSSAPADAQSIAQSLAAAFDFHLAPGKAAIGMTPDPDNQAAFQMGGRVAPEIAGYSNTNKTDGQNPNEPHCNTMVIADNDGGMRWRQYLSFKPNSGGKVRNTLNRNASVIALDSKGELCQSVEEVGQTSDGGQMWYIRFDWARKVVRWGAFKLGWKSEIVRPSNQYGWWDDPASRVDVIDERIAQ